MEPHSSPPHSHRGDTNNLTTLTHLGIAPENTKFLKRLEQKFECMSHSTLMCAVIQNTHCGSATSPIQVNGSFVIDFHGRRPYSNA